MLLLQQLLLLLCCERLAGQFGLIKQKRVGVVRGLRMALIGLLLKWLRLIGCQILDNMCYVGRPIGLLHVRVVGDVAKRSNRRPPGDALWNRHTLLCGVTDGSSGRSSLYWHGSSTARYRRCGCTQVDQPTGCG